MNLGIFEYVKSLPGFDKYHPIFTISAAEIFAEYYNYWVKDGKLFVLYPVIDTLQTLPSYLGVAVIKPSAITTLYVPTELQADISKAGNVAEVDFVSTAKTLLEGFAKGSHNYGFPNRSPWMLCGSNIIKLTRSITTGSGLFKVDILSLSANQLHVDGTMIRPNAFVSEYANVEDIIVPLQHLKYTPMWDIVPDEIKEHYNIYMEKNNLTHGTLITRTIRDRNFAMGEHCYIIDIESGKYRYFVSKTDNNSELPIIYDGKMAIPDCPLNDKFYIEIDDNGTKIGG